MITVSIARRYAKALLELASEQNQLEPVGQALSALGRALAQSLELRDVMSNPAFTTSARDAVAAKILAELKAPTLVVNTVKLLVERGRAGYIESVAREFSAMVDAKLGRVRAKVTSAAPLDGPAVEKIRNQLAKATDKQVTVEPVVDPKILGGVVAQVGSLTFDGSLQTQLETLKRQLLA